MQFSTSATAALLSLLIFTTNTSAAALPVSACDNGPIPTVTVTRIVTPSPTTITSANPQPPNPKPNNSTTSSSSPSPSNASTINALTPGQLVPSSLVPKFSITPGTGIGSAGVPIPKTCPPSRSEFITKLSTAVRAGNVLGTPINFDTNVMRQDKETNRERATAMIIVLQSLSGRKGVGCPGASTPELIGQQKSGVFGSLGGGGG